METINNLLSYKEIYHEWEKCVKNSRSARLLTLKQVEAFEKIVNDNTCWEKLLLIFNSGREIDSWLALDWPDGFDELLLCVPLCSLVEFECSVCTIGKRQENSSCASEDSLFGIVAEFLKRKDRNGLLKHIELIKIMLLDDNYTWKRS